LTNKAHSHGREKPPPDSAGKANLTPKRMGRWRWSRIGI
jgi:hypothetical protein